MKNDSDINEEEIYQLYLGHGGLALCVGRKSYYLEINNFAQISSTQTVSSGKFGREVRQIKRNYKLMQLIRKITPDTRSVRLMGFGGMLLHKTSIDQERSQVVVYDARCPDKCDMIYSGLGVMRAKDVPVLAEFYDWCSRKAKSVMSNFDCFKGKFDLDDTSNFDVGNMYGEFYVRKKVVIANGVETIFDHNVTEDELKRLFYYTMDKDFYINNCALSENDFNCHIYRLLMIRGQKETAQEYLDKLPNDEFKFFRLLNVNH